MAERGLVKCDPKACDEGYTLFSNTGGETACLIGIAGEVVWEYQVPFRKECPPGELGTKAARGDSGGQDSAYAVYRATRHPRQYVDGILREKG